LVSQLYLTATQVSELLQIDESTVYRWASTDVSMPVLRIGGVVRFPAEQLARWLTERQQGARKRGRLIPSQVAASRNVA